MVGDYDCDDSDDYTENNVFCFQHPISTCSATMTT
jgi:hypothetical protein